MSASDCSQLVLNFLLNMRLVFLQNCCYENKSVMVKSLTSYKKLLCYNKRKQSSFKDKNSFIFLTQYLSHSSHPVLNEIRTEILRITVNMFLTPND